MSTAPYFTMITEVLPVLRRDFDLAAPAILNPDNANPLIDGEWLNLNSSYQLERGTGTLAVPSWPVFAERGRYDTQALGKTTVLFGGMYEAQTKVATVAGLAVGELVCVGDVTIDSLTRKGLIEKPAAAATYWVVGVVTQAVSSTIVRFWHYGGHREVTP